MSKYTFQMQVVVDASSQEDALDQVGLHLSKIKCRLANEQKLTDMSPKFTLSDAAADATLTDLNIDLPPIEHVVPEAPEAQQGEGQ